MIEQKKPQVKRKMLKRRYVGRGTLTLDKERRVGQGGSIEVTEAEAKKYVDVLR